MTDTSLEMRFDPQTVRHLGLKMYSQLPAALAEIISNSYDAYATKVGVVLKEESGSPVSIVVMDDGIGLSFSEINEKFLVIGRNRRVMDTEVKDPPFQRKPTGKKGLGKLALFGVAKTITIETRKDGLLNEFILDYDVLVSSHGTYNPIATKINEPTDKSSGTSVTLTNLKRKSSFDTENLIDNLSRIFIFDDNFQVCVVSPADDKTYITNERKYQTIDIQFRWKVEDFDLVKDGPEEYMSITGMLFTTKKPIPPASGLRGVTLYSRGKLVNLPEYFSESTSSHFYSYLTGWISIDFIDDMDEDVISTNRQSLVWDQPEISALRTFLKSLISKAAADWRKKRKKLKDKEIKEKIGIDTKKWIGTLPEDMQSATQHIVDTLGGEETFDKFGSVIESLYKIVPEYAELHWRYLNGSLKGDVADYYKNGMLGEAADQAVKIYFERMRDMTTYVEDGEALVGKSYKSKPFTGAQSPKIRLNDLITETQKNIQVGQAHLSRGVYSGFRNPVNHAPMKKMVPDVFSPMDCLNILSLVSYLMTKLDTATVDSTVT